MKTKSVLVSTLLVLVCLALMTAEWLRLDGDETYVFSAVCAAVLGLCAGIGIRQWHGGRKVWILLPLLAVCAIAPVVQKTGFLREMLTALWAPAVVWFAVAVTRHMSDWERRCRPWLYGVYFVVVFALAAALQYRSRVWLSFEPVQTALRLLCADAAILCASPDRGCTRQLLAVQMYDAAPAAKTLIRHIVSEISGRIRSMRRARLISLVCANVAALLLSLRQDRVYDILFLRGGPVAWLEYRWETLCANLGGRLSSLSEWTQNMMPHKCPISSLAHEYGIASALVCLGLVCLALVLMFLLQRWMPRYHEFELHCRALFACVLMGSVLGILCDVLLVVSSSVRPLLLGRPWDMCSVVALLCLLPNVKNKSASDTD